MLPEFKRSFQRIHELIYLDWFGEIPEESRLQALLNVARYGIGTKGNDGDVRRVGPGLQAPGDLEAADANLVGGAVGGGL